MKDGKQSCVLRVEPVLHQFSFFFARFVRATLLLCCTSVSASAVNAKRRVVPFLNRRTCVCSAQSCRANRKDRGDGDGDSEQRNPGEDLDGRRRAVLTVARLMMLAAVARLVHWSRSIESSGPRPRRRDLT